jgi:tRNA-2-methylthio-N6-dimethylallyladenosine synthase
MNIKVENKKYHIVTYGCLMNEHESEKIEGMLGIAGYSKHDDIKTADVIVVNTCCIREKAEQKIISNIGYLRRYKKANKELVIIVCGCLTQQKDLAKKIFSSFSFINIIIGTQNLHRIPDFLEETLESGKRIISIEQDELKVYEDIPANRYNKPFALVNITYGCNNYCAYCIVPYVRGGERSRIPEKIIEEIINLEKEGYKEITLLGQNVNSYGKGLDNEVNFSWLLKEIESKTNLTRLRFMTSHPKDLSRELIDVFKDRKSICNHIHLPVQSGSSRILKLMNRKYDKEHYLSLVNNLRKASPDIAITTDIIVGFPGENKEDFNETIDLMKKAKFDAAFTFKYSKRSGTKAATMDCQIPKEIKTERIMKLIEIQNKITYNKNKVLIGKTLDVLVEGKREGKAQMYGKTETFKRVNFETTEDLHGQLVKVKILDAKKSALVGELI